MGRTSRASTGALARTPLPTPISALVPKDSRGPTARWWTILAPPLPANTGALAWRPEDRSTANARPDGRAPPVLSVSAAFIW